MKQRSKAFSLLKLSFVILIIGVLVVASEANASAQTSEMEDVMKYMSKKFNTKISPAGTTCNGVVTDGGCDVTSCSVTTANVVQSTVSQGSGSLTCSAGYSGSPTYTCTAGTFTPGGSACTAITCSVSVTGVSSPPSVVYTPSSTSMSCNAAGYTGSVNYTCTTGTLNIVSGSCSRTCTSLSNGAGGTFNGGGLTTNSQYAQKACESFYGTGNCTTGSCGSFSYWYQNGSSSCNCSKPVASYEWIYSNSGYSQVGADYGGQATSVAGDNLFVRQKGSNGCDSNSWLLALLALASGCPGASD